jgi:hypothetical protein
MKAGSSRGPRSIGAGLWFLLLWASAAEAAGQPRYALVIGNNRPPLARADLPSLRYADDDAVRYQELFLRLGAQTHLLTVPDADTQRRHPEVAGRALPPSLEVLRRAVDQVARAADADLARGERPVIYFVFSGHGALGLGPEGEAQLALLDGGLSQEVLHEEILRRFGAAEVHVVVDACHAGAIVGARGSGFFAQELDTRAVVVAPAHEPAAPSFAEKFPTVGVLVAASPEQEAHEWSQFEGGVFTHELLSALSGAADVNADRRIEYSEVQAFIASANRAIHDPRAVPRIIAHPPAIDHHRPLLSLSDLESSTLLAGKIGALGHFRIELENGLRLIDAHLTAGARVALALPERGVAFLRTDDREAEIELAPGGRVDLGALELKAPDLAQRGSLDQTYRRALFSTPYDAGYYQGYVDSVGVLGVPFNEALTHTEALTPAPDRTWSIVWLSAAGVFLATSAVLGVQTWEARQDFDRTPLLGPAEEANRRYNLYGAGALASAGLALGSGILAWVLWPESAP